MSRARIKYEQRATLSDAALQGLFVAAWGAPKSDYDHVLAKSFTWISAIHRQELIGFVNVGWDGGDHFFLLDTTVHPLWRGQGIARRLIEEAIECCRGRGEWLHVDASGGLMAKLYEPCGFVSTPAGLVKLTERLPNVRVRRGSEADVGVVNAFYDSCQSAACAAPGDRLVLAELAPETIGVARLCLEHGHLILRGMQVRGDQQHRGVGRQMLLAIQEWIGDVDCFSLPYAYLERFYGTIGFETVSPEVLPEHLQNRMKEYSGRGLDIIGMKRPARAIAWAAC